MKTACQNCQTLNEMLDRVCRKCGQPLVTVSAVKPSLVRPARRPKMPVVVVIKATFDITGSSQRFADGIPKTFEIIVNQVDAKAVEVVVTVQTHGDLDEGQQMVLVTDRDTPAQAIEDVRMLTFGGGGDPEEHHLDAIENLLHNTEWPSDISEGRGCILAFMTADTKPARSGISARELGQAIHAKGLLLYLISEPTPALQELVDAAQGLMFQITNDPDPAQLQQIAAQVAASIVATVSTGGTVPMPSSHLK